MPERLESCSLVALFERVCSRYASHQHDTKYDDVLCAEAEEIPRAR